MTCSGSQASQPGEQPSPCAALLLGHGLARVYLRKGAQTMRASGRLEALGSSTNLASHFNQA